MSSGFADPMHYQSPYKTMQQAVVDRLQRAIAQGNLVPGARLRYPEIAKEMNTSVTPVREAVKTLEALGLVTVRPHYGAFVSYLTQEELIELYELRALLEGIAIASSVQRASDQQVVLLSEVFKNMKEPLKVLTGTPDEAARSHAVVSLQRLHEEFHSSLYAPCGNRFLLEAINLLRKKVSTYFPAINRFDAKRITRSHRQHRDILAAFEAREPEAAAIHLRNHLNDMVPWIIENMGAIPSEDGVAARLYTQGSTMNRRGQQDSLETNGSPFPEDARTCGHEPMDLRSSEVM